MSEAVFVDTWGWIALGFLRRTFMGERFRSKSGTHMKYKILVVSAIFVLTGCGSQDTSPPRKAEEQVKQKVQMPSKPVPPKYQEVGYWKRDKNRVYTIYCPNIDWARMEKYAKGCMHTQGRTTSVFFFNDRAHTPNVTLLRTDYWGPVVDYIYDSEASKYCVARYDKWPSGEEAFVKYPMRH